MMYDYGKIPPIDTELEKLILGSILLEPVVIREVYNVLSAECFYRESHKLIWGAVAALYEEMATIDINSVTIKLRKSGKLEDAEGVFYITRLPDETYNVHAIFERSLYLKELYLRRRLIECCSKVIQSLYEDTTDVFEEMSNIQIQLDKLVNEITKLQEVNFSDAVVNRSQQLTKIASDKTYKTGELTYLRALDEETNGFQPGDLIIVGGRPSMGKTAWAIDCARKQAKNHTPVGFFSLEMNQNKIIDRMFAQEGDINMREIRKGTVELFNAQKLNETTVKLAGYPFYMSDKAGLTINDICAKAKLWKMKYGIKIIYVDYIQLVQVAENKNKTRDQEVNSITTKLKALAGDLQIPVVALSQLGRDVEKRKPPEPILSDLRESGGIEQDADIVLFPFRPYYYDKNEPKDLCRLIMAKYRDGKPGEVQLKFSLAYQRFDDWDEPF